MQNDNYNRIYNPTAPYTGLGMLYKIREQLCGYLKAYADDFHCAFILADRDPEYSMTDKTYCGNVCTVLSILADIVYEHMENMIDRKAYVGKTDYQILRPLNGELQRVIQSNHTKDKIIPELKGRDGSKAFRYALTLASAKIWVTVYEWYRHHFTEAYADGRCSEAYDCPDC